MQTICVDSCTADWSIQNVMQQTYWWDDTTSTVCWIVMLCLWLVMYHVYWTCTDRQQSFIPLALKHWTCCDCHVHNTVTQVRTFQKIPCLYDSIWHTNLQNMSKSYKDISQYFGLVISDKITHISVEINLWFWNYVTDNKIDKKSISQYKNRKYEIVLIVRIKIYKT